MGFSSATAADGRVDSTPAQHRGAVRSGTLTGLAERQTGDEIPRERAREAVAGAIGADDRRRRRRRREALAAGGGIDAAAARSVGQHERARWDGIAVVGLARVVGLPTTTSTSMPAAATTAARRAVTTTSRAARAARRMSGS